MEYFWDQVVVGFFLVVVCLQVVVVVNCFEVEGFVNGNLVEVNLVLVFERVFDMLEFKDN